MNDESKGLWQELARMAETCACPEASLADLRGDTRTLAELLSIGALAELSEDELAALAVGKSIGANVICLIVGDDWLYLRVSSREQLRHKLGAQRELLRRRIAMARATQVDVRATPAWAAMQSLRADAILLQRAEEYAVSERDWSIYGNMPHDFFVRHWNKLHPDDVEDRVKTLALLMRIAFTETNSSPEQLMALKADIAAADRLTAMLAEIAQSA